MTKRVRLRAAKKLGVKGVSASIWKRGFAYIIDLVVIYFVIWIPFKQYISSSVEINNHNFSGALRSVYTAGFGWDMLFISSILAILTVLYWALLEWKVGQSVGKIAMGLYVVSEDGERGRFVQYLVRNVTKISFLVLLLDCLYFFKTKHQRYFESLSGTRVVEYGGNC